MPLAAPLGLAEAVHQVELVEEPRRHRHGPVDAAAALLEGLEDHGLTREVDVLGRERECLGDPAPVVWSTPQRVRTGRAALAAAARNATRSSAVK